MVFGLGRLNPLKKPFRKSCRATAGVTPSREASSEFSFCSRILSIAKKASSASILLSAYKDLTSRGSALLPIVKKAPSVLTSKRPFMPSIYLIRVAVCAPA
jgi:hypothetical protein